MKYFKISRNPFGRGTDFLSWVCLEPMDRFFHVQARILQDLCRRS